MRKRHKSMKMIDREIALLNKRRLHMLKLQEQHEEYEEKMQTLNALKHEVSPSKLHKAGHLLKLFGKDLVRAEKAAKKARKTAIAKRILD